MTERPKIVVTRQPVGDAVATLGRHGDVWLWSEDRPIPADLLLEQIPDAHGLYSMFTDEIGEDLLDAGPNLRAISQMAVGVDNIDVTACTERGIPVGYTPDVLTEATADFAFGLLLAAARRIAEARDFVRRGEWELWSPDMLLGRDLHGSVIGIVGLGRIGTAVGRRAAGFDARILYHNRSRNREAERELHAEYCVLNELLGRSDHVVLLCPLTDETHHLIDADRLSRMSPHANLVNCARGPVVDLDALYHALKEGRIGGAAIDVTEPEPIPPEHPILELDNCIVTPHIGSASVSSRSAMGDLAASNLISALEGERMPHCVNVEVYAENLDDHPTRI